MVKQSFQKEDEGREGTLPCISIVKDGAPWEKAEGKKKGEAATKNTWIWDATFSNVNKRTGAMISECKASPIACPGKRVKEQIAKLSGSRSGLSEGESENAEGGMRGGGHSGEGKAGAARFGGRKSTSYEERF